MTNKGFGIVGRLYAITAVLVAVMAFIAVFAQQRLNEIVALADTTEQLRVPQLQHVSAMELNVTRVSLQLRHAILARTPEERDAAFNDIKAKRKQMQMEVSRRRMMQNVPGATVVVMNPTHYAVALRYEQGQTAAPECVAKGLDDLALRIRALAEESGVPVIEDPPLARALYATTEVDRQIPEAHYQAVAKIIGFVMGQKAARARTLR